MNFWSTKNFKENGKSSSTTDREQLSKKELRKLEKAERKQARKEAREEKKKKEAEIEEAMRKEEQRIKVSFVCNFLEKMLY